MKNSFFFNLVAFILILFQTFSVFAQQGIEIRGKVVEATTRTPLEFVTVVVSEKETEHMIAGTTSDADGNFILTSGSQHIFIELTFIGFQSEIIRDFKIENNRIDLGMILLQEESTTLDEVTVRAERSQTEFKLDKRVFNVGQDLSSAGASALEVLNNVPSVTVSIEGDIRLRGSSGVQILLNGKPSVLTDGSNALGSITADMIDRIEVITNPSAKYDAEGTSGILNIVLKKEEKRGLNGSVTLNTGIPNNHSLGMSLNRRTEKFNLFSQVGVGYRTYPNKSETINRDKLTLNEVNSFGTNERNENFYNLILGTDYHINENNVITLSGSFAYEIESEYSNTDFSQLMGGRDLEAQWNRTEETSAINPKYQYELQYKSDIGGDEDHTLLFSAIGRFFGKDQQSVYDNVASLGTLATTSQEVFTDFKDENHLFKLDYTKPVNQEITLETGAQFLINDVGNDFEVRDFVDGTWINNVDQTNNFEFRQSVLGVYATGAYEGKQWGIKAGLRLENTNVNSLLTTTDASNDQDYLNLFPSLHTSYNFSDAFSIQAGYSRRIFRPRMWDLNPFFNIRNNFNVRTGNPELQPEFTDSYEVNSIYVLGKASLNLGVYHRFTTDVVERVVTYEDNISTTKPLNVGTNRTTGVEFNGKYTPTRKITLSGDFNYNYFSRAGTFQDRNFDFSADQWMARIRTKFNLPADFEVELTGNYQSREVGIQAVQSANAFLDFGVRKKLMKGKTIINFSVRDVFASRFRESIANQPEFYVYNYGLRGRFVILGVSYGFGKGEAMEFSGHKHF